MELRECVKCHQHKPISEFRKSQTRGTRNCCKTCESIDRNNRRKLDLSGNLRAARKLRSKYSQSRRNQIDTARWILEDTKRSDKKRNLEFDLTKDWIQDQIQKGCSYCGEMKLRMTLDRIDNSIGHIKTNVTPACIRCNYMRRDMPYEAWVSIVPAVRKAVEFGLFGDWTGSPHKTNAGIVQR